MVKKFSKGKIGLFVLVIIIGISAVGCSSSPSDDEVVAKIGDMAITKSEFYDELVDQSGAQVLDILIADRIMQSEVEKQNIDISRTCAPL